MNRNETKKFIADCKTLLGSLPALMGDSARVAHRLSQALDVIEDLENNQAWKIIKDLENKIDRLEENLSFEIQSNKNYNP